MRHLILIAALLSFITCRAQQLPKDFADKVCAAAISIEDPSIIYDGSYVRIPYPGGDVDPSRGVCTDVVIRTFRKVGLDLQVLVADWRKNVQQASNVDTNIDHRRCWVLRPFFNWFSKQHGFKVQKGEPLTKGSIIFFKLGGRTDHVGIYVGDGKFIHNIGGGQVIDELDEHRKKEIVAVYTLRE